jgi:amino acid transporter
MSVLSVILGRPLASNEHEQTKIGVLAGVPAMGLDGLTSSAYGPEAALTILLPLGAAGLSYIGPITLVILALLAMLYFSYRQTIAAYPVNGGSYTVARENLGVWFGLLAASALMIDYVLNVAVGVSAGVAALVSAVPSLHHYTLWICLAILLVITIVNLRGTGEAGIAFALPTYLFIGSLGLVLIIGLLRAVTSHGHPHAAIPPPAVPRATEAVSLWILLRSFASGCTAMTGVEAVSNGVSAFREPAVKNANRTLTFIVIVLAALLGLIAYLAHAYQVGAMDQDQEGYQSVLSQLTHAVIGGGWFYYVTIVSVLATLCLAANTSFVGFPRLCRLIAEDDFLPRPFAIVGRRLVFSVGIGFLAAAAGLLLIVFRGITDRLIPLFAVGAFLAFTLSQAGMVMHWYRQGGGRLKLAINGVGAVATAVALAIILAAKFVEGAWITILTIPVLLTLFKLVKRHYEMAEREIAARTPLQLEHNQPPVVLVPIRHWNRMVNKALRFAMWLSGDVIGVHLCNLDGDERDDAIEQFKREWARDVEQPARRANVPVPRLMALDCPYRNMAGSLMRQIDQIKQEYPERLIAVVVPELIGRRWWDYLLHRRKAAKLRNALIQRGDHRVVLVSVPWYLEE